MLEVGDVYTSTATVKDATGTLVNPTTVTYTITQPDLTVVGPTTVSPTSTGVFNLAFTIAQSGQHLLDWVGTGSNAFSQSDVFNAAATNPGFIISLAEARSALGTAAGNTVSDEDLRLFIAGATPIMEDLVGDIVAHSRSETYDGGQGTIALLHTPVMSVTSIIESYGSVQYTLTAQDIFSGSGSTSSWGYSIDLASGLINRRVAGSGGLFASGYRNVQVNYVSGQVLAGNQRLAARRLIRHLWQSEQQGFRPQMGAPDAMGTTPSGFAVPKAVLEMLAGSRRPVGIA